MSESQASDTVHVIQTMRSRNGIEMASVRKPLAGFGRDVTCLSLSKTDSEQCIERLLFSGGSNHKGSLGSYENIKQ